MRRKHVVTIGLGMIAVLSLGTVAMAEDGRAAFQKRHDTMKEMGRALYLWLVAWRKDVRSMGRIR